MSSRRVGDIAFKDLTAHDREVVRTALKSGASRREVMGWLLASGATIAAAGSIVTAASEALAMTPKKGGKVRMAWDLHGPSDTLDPILQTSTADYSRCRLTYNSLTRPQPDLSVTPELAESWEANDDVTVWTFKLRRDVTWHDGSKFTADDVVYALNRHVGPDTKSKAKALSGSIKEWKKVDDYTVQAILSQPNGEIPQVLATFHFKICKNGATDFSLPIGTGPYKIKEFLPGVRSVHVRNDDYWGEGGPYVEEIEIFGITDTVARTNALLSGDVQVVGNLDVKAIPQVEAQSGVDVFTVPSGAYLTICCMMDKDPGRNLDFVLGLKYLQRRDRVLQVIQKGNGDIGRDHPIGPAYGVDHCADVAIRPYDPDKAKFHLTKSGVTTATIDVAEVGPGLTDQCLLLQRECAKIGFDLKINKVPNDGYWGAIWLKTPIHVVSWNMRPTANIMMSLAYHSEAPWNETRWKNERFDSLLVAARAELDPAKKKEMNCELQTLVSEKSGSLIAAHRSYIDGIASNIKGVPKVPLGGFGGSEFGEFFWIDS